jgi:hypothetical protein
MENNERDRKLDQWLDEALSEYGAAEPRFGLEQRVLNRIRGEEQPSRKWNFWRWMPAFGAIAAVVVVTVAIRPMLTRKNPMPQMQERIGTYSSPQQQSTKAAEAKGLSTEASVVEQHTPPVNNAATEHARINAAPKRALAQGGDRDKVSTSPVATMDPQLRDSRSHQKQGPVTTANGMARNQSETMGLLPPPPPQVQPGVAGGVIGGPAANVPSTAPKSAPAKPNEDELKANAGTVEVRTDAPALVKDKVVLQSLTSIIAKDARRKEAHAKRETTGQDTNVIDVFGVAVRFQTNPTTPTRFPTPVPLSKQEKLALEAGSQLKDSAVAQHKSTEITPIEIKNIEIKPLEGPDKDQ